MIQVKTHVNLSVLRHHSELGWRNGVLHIAHGSVGKEKPKAYLGLGICCQDVTCNPSRAVSR